MRSRTMSLPCSRCRFTAASLPPARAVGEALAQLGDEPVHVRPVLVELGRGDVDV